MNQSASLCLMHVSVKDLLCLSVSVSLCATWTHFVSSCHKISIFVSHSFPRLSCQTFFLFVSSGPSVLNTESVCLLNSSSSFAFVSVSRVLSGCIRIEGKLHRKEVHELQLSKIRLIVELKYYYENTGDALLCNQNLPGLPFESRIIVKQLSMKHQIAGKVFLAHICGRQ